MSGSSSERQIYRSEEENRKTKSHSLCSAPWLLLWCLCHVTVDTLCAASRRQRLLYEMWICDVKGNTVHGGQANMAERGAWTLGSEQPEGPDRSCLWMTLSLVLTMPRGWPENQAASFSGTSLVTLICLLVCFLCLCVCLCLIRSVRTCTCLYGFTYRCQSLYHPQCVLILEPAVCVCVPPTLHAPSL